MAGVPWRVPVEGRPDAETAHPTQQKDRRLPAAPGAVQRGIENAVGRDSPALGADRKTVRRWHKQGVRPNGHYLLALQDLAKGRGLGHLFTVRATPYQTAESEGREESGQGPADRTTEGEQKAGRPGHSQEGLRLSPRKDQRAMPRQRAHHNIGEATMSPGRCKASSHTCTRGGRRRAVRSNLLSTRRRDRDGGSPIASLPELSGSLMERLRGSE